MPAGLAEVTGSAAAYAVVIALVALDVFFPLIPGETAVIAAGVLAADGELSVSLVVLAAAAGALLGDNAVYGVGRGFCSPILEGVGRSSRTRELTAWARRQLRHRRLQIIVTARFVPAGRTATSLGAGSVSMPWRRFLGADLVASLLWAALMTSLGVAAGSTFEGSLWRPLLASMTVGLMIAAGAEVYRRRRIGAGVRSTGSGS